MPLFNIFRNFFGGHSSDEPRSEGFSDHRSYEDRFRNPIWQNDDDDDDDDDLRHPRDGIHFNIATDPFQITRYFESQMESMLKDFVHGFGMNDFMAALPAAPPQEKSLRDNVLNPDHGSTGLPDRYKQKVDMDLDGKITPAEFSKAWDNPERTQIVEPFVPQRHTFGRSIRKEFYRRPDGTIEQKQTFTDSEGNEETIVTRQIGDKKYTVSTKRDKNGVETKTEDLINMDENEVKNFTEHWTPLNDTNKHRSSLKYFPWERLFGPDPKL